MTRPFRLLRPTAGFVANWLTAVIGTAIIEDEFSNLFHPRTVEDVFLKWVFLSAIIAFLLGCLAYYKWKSTSAMWVWVTGVCGFGYQVLSGVRLFQIERDLFWASLTFVSVRAVSYSLGAICSPAITRFFFSAVDRVRGADSRAALDISTDGSQDVQAGELSESSRE